MSLAQGRPTRRETLQRHFDALDRDREEARLRRAGEAAGECIGDCGGNMANLDCEGLAREKEHVEQAQRDAQMANASYSENPSDLPPGYRSATRQELIDLELLDPETGRSHLRNDRLPDFGANVFVDPKGNYVVGFQGTDFSKRADLHANYEQFRGLETPYYTQAMAIGRTVTRNAEGKTVRFVGHSLGGGMASAAARSTGHPAATFNAAGLHPNTVPSVAGNAPINAWYVRGEILSFAQNNTFGAMPAAAGRRLPLNPGTPGNAVFLLGPGLVSGARSFDLHRMHQVHSALDAKHKAIEELQDMKGCTR